MTSVRVLAFTSNPFLSENGIDSTIHDIYKACFEAIQSDTQAHIAMYMWHDENKPKGINNPGGLTQSFIESVKHAGASASVLFDVDYLYKKNVMALKQRFSETGIDAIFPAFKNPNRGINGRPKMHHKMMLFSTLRFPPDSDLTELAGKTIDNVVVQSSANIWASQYKQSNQLIVYYGDSAFYDYNLRVWKSLSADLQKGELTSFSRNTPPDFDSGKVKAYSLPRKSNIILGILNNIIKTSQSKPPIIRIAMGHFSNIDIAKRLARITELYKDSVKIIARNDDVSNKVLDILEPTVDIRLLENKRRGNKIHSKFMLLDADYPIGNVKRRQLAWAGSLNYTSAALSKNSETLIRMENDDVYNHLLSAWNQLRDAAKIRR